MLVLVCGDRNWTDRKKVADRLAILPQDTIVIHGACRGADQIAGEEAKKLGFIVHEFPADWSKYGKMAGPVRNSQMLAEKPDLVLAFHPNLNESKGTADTVRKARVARMTVEVIT